MLVVDGCRPDEITPVLTPTLAGLRNGGMNFPRATSLPVMETIPNHVMMMTGLRPDRTGVPANAIYDRRLGDTRTLDQPRDLRSSTVIQRLNKAGFTTATVLSKDYLVGIFGKRATYRWVPQGYIPVSGHVPDAATMDATLSMIEDHDPNMVFVNLGDIDRMGHSDETGPTPVQAARRAALADTDAQVARLVQELRSSGRWEHSLVVVLADHSMDWSLPDARVAVGPALEADPLLAGKVAIAENGGAELLYWLGPDSERDAAVTRMRRAALSVDGVLRAHPRTRRSLRLGPEAGDVVLFCEPGRRFSEAPQNNPIPGNHGHPVTRPIPFFLSGGHPRVPRGSSRGRARTMDVAPTLSRFFGVGGPRGGYDGTSRL
ncbi:alkaline phosphatase family protein [Nocardioides coralli]|nr:alkaline phosphatase family protein [Nocardioides coralli]